MKARIYQPSKTAMQSGPGKTDHWRLDFEQSAPRELDPLMGWTSSADTRQQLRLEFPTKEEAIAYAEKNGIEYQLFTPKKRRPRPKSYADNFAWTRKLPFSLPSQEHKPA